MARSLRFTSVLLVACFAVLSLSGCAGFRKSVSEMDPDKAKPMDASYDYADKRTMTDEIAAQILANPHIKKLKEPPVMAMLHIENRTRRHIDTKGIAETLRNKLLRSGKALFVNAARRDQLLEEQQYHAKHVSAETRAAIGKQLGAKYILTGAISDDVKESGREVRISKKEEIYYFLTIEVTDVTTGLIIGAPQAERVRKASKPIIGW